MENDVIVFLINAVIIIWLIVGVLMAAIKGIPLAGETAGEMKQLVLTIVPILRRLFDPNTALANALKAKGIDPALADKVSELTADTIEYLLKHTQPHEATPPQEVNLGAIDTNDSIDKSQYRMSIGNDITV